MLPVREMAMELRRLALLSSHLNAPSVQLLKDAADKLERYDELFRWSNENCRDCAEGRVPRHAQPLPDPESQASGEANAG